MNAIKPENVMEKFSPPRWSKSDFLILAGILLFGAFLIALQRFMEFEMGRDSTYYLPLVEIWKNQGFQALLEVIKIFWFPPLHLASLVILSHAGLSPECSAVALGMFFGILMPLVSFCIAHELFRDKRISFAAALFTAINPSIIEMSVQAQRDVPYLFFAGWCLYFLIVSIRLRKWFYWCFAGIFFGISMLIRYETAEFLPLLGIYFVVVLCKKAQKWQFLFRDMAIFAASGVVTVILLLWSIGILEYMIGSYYRYFCMQTEYLLGLYNGGVQK